MHMRFIWEALHLQAVGSLPIGNSGARKKASKLDRPLEPKNAKGRPKKAVYSVQ